MGGPNNKKVYNKIEKIMKKLKKLWYFYPHLRLGQLLENYVFEQGERGDETSCKMFYQSDEETWDNINKGVK